MRRLPDTRLMSHALASLFCAGAGLAGLTLLLPHSPAVEASGLFGFVADALIVAALLIIFSSNMPRWVLPIALALGTIHVTGVAYFSAAIVSPLTFFYLWVFLYAAYFFSRWEAAAQIVFVGVNLAFLLTLRTPEYVAASWWMVGMGSMMVAAILVATMRERAESLISQLYESARIDPLTKLMNRRGFRELLDLEIERASRGESEMALVIGDVDFFKEVNDRSGHAVGDAVLRRLARVLEDGKRRIDAAARVGGEEFALVLTGVDQLGAYGVAERLRIAVEEEFARDPVKVTISFGVAAFPAQARTAGALLRSADDALYAAKSGGRNRTVVHSAELETLLTEDRGKRDIGGERYLAILLDLAEAADLRFSGSARHSETVGRYAETIARELGMPPDRVHRVRLAGVLHDIGKVSISEKILQKPGKLDADEWVEVRRHPELGAQMLDHPELADIRGWVLAHHERPDGAGYPRGLRGEEQPLEARILSVADAYETMTCDRAYRASLGHQKARSELLRCAGTQFDSAVVTAFLRVLNRESQRAAVEVPS